VTNGVCTLCSLGTYNSQSGQTSCTNCPANTFNNNTGSTSYDSCQSCATGYTANPGSSSCTIVECFWVVESWKKMGRTTSVSSTSATACCYYLGSTTQTSGIPGVTCNSIGIVTVIGWYAQSLQGSIPSSLGNLTNLQYL